MLSRSVDHITSNIFVSGKDFVCSDADVFGNYLTFRALPRLRLRNPLTGSAEDSLVAQNHGIVDLFPCYCGCHFRSLLHLLVIWVCISHQGRHGWGRRVIPGLVLVIMGLRRKRRGPNRHMRHHVW